MLNRRWIANPQISHVHLSLTHAFTGTLFDGINFRNVELPFYNVRFLSSSMSNLGDRGRWVANAPAASMQM